MSALPSAAPLPGEGVRRVAPPVPLTALLLAAASVVAALVSVVVATRADAWSVPAMANQPVDLAAATGCAVIGALVLAGRDASRRLGWLFLGTGAVAGLVCLVTALASAATTVTPLARTSAQLNGLVWPLGFFPLLTLLPLLHPDGRLPGPRWRPVLVTAVVATALMCLASGLHPELLDGRAEVPKWVTLAAPARLLGPVIGVALVLTVLASLAALVVRLRRSEGLVRRQAAVLLAAYAVLAAEVAVNGLLPEGLAPFVQAGAVLLLPVATGVAITRHRLFELDLVIVRALVAASVAACLAGVYLTAVTLLGAALGSHDALSTGLAAAGTALLVQPLAVRLGRAAERLLYGDRTDPFAVVTRFAQALRDGVAVEDLPATVARTVVDALRLGSATVEVAGSTATAGQPHPAPTVEAYAAELRHRGRTVGRLLVTPRPGEHTLDARDREILTAIADHVAPALSSVATYAELRRSREALVAAREEERRRLRRDLHDGVGAALAGVRLQLESGRALVADPTAGRLLDAAAAGVAEAVGDVRRVTEDLRPPALDDLGLAGALRALAERLAGPDREVAVAVGELPALPAAVEVAGYRVAAEALANAVRHSGATRVRLAASVADGHLVVEVADDGRGIGTDARTDGVGLASIQQRVEEVGGRLTIRSDVGTAARPGTVVHVELPGGLA